jgi:hypothetical protein
MPKLIRGDDRSLTLRNSLPERTCSGVGDPRGLVGEFNTVEFRKLWRELLHLLKFQKPPSLSFRPSESDALIRLKLGVGGPVVPLMSLSPEALLIVVRCDRPLPVGLAGVGRLIELEA